ncbi:MAG: cytochrome c [Acidobacteria bacterium]|nr:cytochrome c [Acidobacteriota bacterium]
MNAIPPFARVSGRGWPAGRVSALAIAVPLLLATALPAQQTAPVVLSIELPDNATGGVTLFAQKGCIRCHSLSGAPARIGPDLGRIAFSGTMLDLAGAFWNHAPAMQEHMLNLKIQRPSLTRGEMATLLAFLTLYRYSLKEVDEPGDPVAGRKVFVAKRCAECHDEGVGAWDKPGPGLQRYRGRYSAIFLAQAMWNHAPAMAVVMRTRGVPWPKFAGREMADLVSYLRAGNAGTVSERMYFQPGNPRRGQALFSDKQCNACHAIAGTGGRGGPDLGMRVNELVRSIAEVAGLMWNHSQQMTAQFRRRGIAPVTFSGQEMADVIAYLYYINYATVRGLPARGQQMFDEKCSVCHATAEGRRVGPDLATIPRLDDPIAIIAAMWNHAPTMEQKLRARGLTWPKFKAGEAADLSAFLLSQRAAARGDVARP